MKYDDQRFDAHWYHDCITAHANHRQKWCRNYHLNRESNIGSKLNWTTWRSQQRPGPSGSGEYYRREPSRNNIPYSSTSFSKYAVHNIAGLRQSRNLCSKVSGYVYQKESGAFKAVELGTFKNSTTLPKTLKRLVSGRNGHKKPKKSWGVINGNTFINSSHEKIRTLNISW